MSPSNEWFPKGENGFLCWQYFNICLEQVNINSPHIYHPESGERAWWSTQKLQSSFDSPPFYGVPFQDHGALVLPETASETNSYGNHIVSVALKPRWK